MSIWGEEALQAWAIERGLRFEGEGLFPAVTSLLREGLGAGQHRAGLVVSETAHSLTSVGGFSKKPERHTANICRGRLPGGIDGAVGHHFHLEYRHTGGEGDGDEWLAVPHTVVLAYVQAGACVARELKLQEPEVWSTDPPESPDDIHEMTQHANEALAAAPAGTSVEMRDGSICVAAHGVIEDGATLDSLCRVAAAVADGARHVAARYAPLDPTAPTGAQVLPPELQWVEPMVDQISWPEPPPSVPAAMAAYAGLHGDYHRETSRTVSMFAIVALFVGGLIWFGIDSLLAVAFNMPFEAVVGAVIGICGAPVAIRAALRTGRETADEGVAARSRLPGSRGVRARVREVARDGARGPRRVQAAFREPRARRPAKGHVRAPGRGRDRTTRALDRARRALAGAVLEPGGASGRPERRRCLGTGLPSGALR
ncbi:MAG: hypothetical protein QOH76_4062 [Thermoleophilaceae bacterium]|nr:hypothetical protein [Thermoleophilaceae bacterium]